MAYTNNKLNAFLNLASQAARAGMPARIYLGNEASDLDSMASSVLYAFSKGAVSDGLPNIPVMNIPREDFNLRTEAAWLFKECGVSAADLLFLDDLDLDRLFAAGGAQLVLVDHNKLGNRQSAWADAVVEIIDHHANEGLYPAAKKVIEPTGSASTLVAEVLLASVPDDLESGAAALALGTILLDTVNLDPDAKRVTPRDEAVAQKLLDAVTLDRNALFESLQFEKFNVAALSSRDILRKDYKEYRMGSVVCGIASALLPLTDWMRKDAALDDSFKAYLNERKLDVLLVMSAYTAPAFTRELAVHSENSDLRKRLIEFMNQSGLGLTSLVPGSASTDYCAQADLSQSRKKLQPLLSDHFQKA
jgi:exopolyphosphatase